MPFQSEDYSDEFGIDMDYTFMPSQVSVVYTNSTDTALAINGGFFDICKNISVSVGDGGEFKYEPKAELFTDGAASTCGGTKPASISGSETVIPRSSSLITVKIPLQYLKGAKQIIVAQGDDDSVMLSLAATPDVPTP